MLSYLIAKHPESSFYIYSNDRDYQTVIDFWQDRGIKVCRKGFTDTDGKKSKKKKGKKKKAKKKQDMVEKVRPSAKAVMESACTLEKSGQEKLTEEQYVVKIAQSVPVTDLEGGIMPLLLSSGRRKDGTGI